MHAQFNYTTNDGAITITGYDGSGGAVTIPSMTNGHPVTRIGDCAFQFNTNLSSVTIPSTVTSIGRSAFSYCSNLTSVIIPGSVTYIGEWAFAYSPLSGIVIPGSVTDIENFTFQGCSCLTNLIIPDRITTIGINSFYSCSSLASVTLPNSLTNIDANAFYGCTNLARVTIPASVLSVHSQAFYGCSNLTEITIPSSITTLEPGIFYGCSSLTNLTIPSSVTSIERSALYGCSSLTNIAIPKGVTNIVINVFTGCSRLCAIEVDHLNAVYTSAEGVLFNKNQSTLIRFPEGKAASYTIPDSVTNIEAGAFYDCSRLNAIGVNALNSAYSSADGVLFNKNQTTLLQYPGGKAGSYTIPGSISSIGEAAFLYCTSLTGITIPDNVTSIGNYAFNYCTSLTSITLPKSITSIGEWILNGSTNLTAVYYRGNAPNPGSSLFLVLNDTIAYYLPGFRPPFNSGCSICLWSPQVQTRDGCFGVQTNHFGFNITGTSNLVVVVEACTSLVNPVWTPVQTNTLINGFGYFSDPQFTNHPGRFYRMRTP